MISVVLYGRNDSHGYHLQKRAAISLNGIAEVLSHPDDEILFVDCNTPDTLPTFPESIHDTLTDEAKRLLKVIRLRPRAYARASGGSPLSVTEALCRNVAVRRSNPRNRWLLSTNSDMVFVPAEGGVTLSEAAAGLGDGFYLLPRFDVPEWLWEGLDRRDPAGNLERLREWGRAFHLNEVNRHDPEIGFDSPGDFQLILREQLFAIHGFDEDMRLGWNVDANIGKRLFLLNGGSRSVLPSFFGYHCNHNLQANALHAGSAPRNDWNRFFRSVTDPFLPKQKDAWGLAGEELEVLRPAPAGYQRFESALRASLPGLLGSYTERFCGSPSFNANLLYDTLHVFPFVANFLGGLAPGARVGYLGANLELLQLLSRFIEEEGSRLAVLADPDLFAIGEGKPPEPPPAGVLWADPQAIGGADLYLLDAGLPHAPRRERLPGCTVPVETALLGSWLERLTKKIDELRKAAAGDRSGRPFVFVGFQNTVLERLMRNSFDTVIGGMGTAVHYGRARLGPLPDAKDA
jgi:hypothetical protein